MKYDLFSELTYFFGEGVCLSKSECSMLQHDLGLRPGNEYLKGPIIKKLPDGRYASFDMRSGLGSIVVVDRREPSGWRYINLFMSKDEEPSIQGFYLRDEGDFYIISTNQESELHIEYYDNETHRVLDSLGRFTTASTVCRSIKEFGILPDEETDLTDSTVVYMFSKLSSDPLTVCEYAITAARREKANQKIKKNKEHF